MAIAFVNAADLGNNSGNLNLTSAYTVGGGTNRLLVVAVIGDTGANDNIVGVTYGGVAMTLAAKHAGGERYTYLYLLLNPASGPNNVVVNNGNTATWIIAGAADYTGVRQSAQPDATATNISAATTTLTTAITTVADNCWTILATQNVGTSGPAAAGTGSTARALPSLNDGGFFDSNAAQTPAGSHSMQTTTAGNADIVHVMASFAPDTGAPVVSNAGRAALLGVGN